MDSQSRIHERRASLPALTGVRFVAALLVVLRHFGQPMVFAVPVIGPVLARMTWSGFVAVNFFFILSGFVLAYSYLDQQGQMRGGSSTFWLARFARIYPMYLVGLMLVVPATIAWSPDDTVWHSSPIGTIAATLALVQDWIPNWQNAWNPPAWSLGVEALFYALFPWVASPVYRLARRPLVLGAACWIVMGAFIAAFSVGLPTHAPFVFFADPTTHFAEFCMGIMAARAFRDRVFQRHASAMVALAGTACAVALAFGPAIPFFALRYGILDPIFTVLILGLAYGAGTVARVLAHKRTVVLGEASYGLYIIHWPVYLWVAGLTRPVPTSRLFPWFLTVYVLVVVACSLAGLHWIEQPARRALRQPRTLTGRRTVVRIIVTACVLLGLGAMIGLVESTGMAAGSSCGIAGSIGSRPIIAFGDSITVGQNASRMCLASHLRVRPVATHRVGSQATNYPGDLQRLLHRPVMDFGWSGETTDEGEGRLRAVLSATHPSLVVLDEGVNDLQFGESPRHALRQLADMVREAKRAGARVVLVTPAPTHIPHAVPRSRANHEVPILRAGIIRLGRQLHVTVADVYGAFLRDGRGATLTRAVNGTNDGIHPNDAGYRIMARTIASTLRYP